MILVVMMNMNVCEGGDGTIVVNREDGDDWGDVGGAGHADRDDEGKAGSISMVPSMLVVMMRWCRRCNG